MKKTLCFIALGTVLCATPFLTTQAQEDNTPAEKKNLVKVNLLPLATGTFAFEYERALTNKFTVGAMVSFRSENSKLPFVSSWQSALGDEDLEATLSNTTLGAFSTAVEGRFYTGKKGAFRGFYLAPYVKYAKYSIDAPIEVDLEADGVMEPINEINTSGDINTFSAGLGIGVQFKLGKNVSLDWRILGLGYGTSNGGLKGAADRNLTPDEQAEVREQLDDLDDIPLFTIKSKTVTAEGVDIQIKGPWAGLRTGLSIGYKF